MKSGLLNLLTVFVSVALALLVAEVVLRFLPVATELPVEPAAADNPIQRYVANHPFTASLDWNMAHVVRGRSNAQGYRADYEYEAADPRPLVAVIGDSYIEAFLMPFAQSLTGRLQAAFGDRGRAYAFAQSGAPLSHYVAYARHACTVYRPARMVVSVVGNDFDESVFAHRRRNGIFHLYPRPEGGFEHKLTSLPAPGVVEHVLRQSVLAVYLMRNVGITKLIAHMGFNLAHTENRYVGQTEADTASARIEEGHRVIDWFLGALPQAACLTAGDIVILVDAPRPEVYDAAALAATQRAISDRCAAESLSKRRRAASR